MPAARKSKSASRSGRKKTTRKSKSTKKSAPRSGRKEQTKKATSRKTKSAKKSATVTQLEKRLAKLHRDFAKRQAAISKKYK